MFKPYLNKLLFLRFFILTVLFFCGCASVQMNKKNWADNTLKKLSLREKIAQMMIFRMHLKYKYITPWD